MRICIRPLTAARSLQEEVLEAEGLQLALLQAPVEPDYPPFSPPSTQTSFAAPPSRHPTQDTPSQLSVCNSIQGDSMAPAKVVRSRFSSVECALPAETRLPHRHPLYVMRTRRMKRQSPGAAQWKFLCETVLVQLYIERRTYQSGDNEGRSYCWGHS
jgi:hypothetical protein